MTATDRVFIAINMALATISCAVHVVVAVRLARLRALSAASATLAAMYVGAYVWLLVDPDVVHWSQIMRGVSIVVWPLIWILPGVTAVRARNDLVAKVGTVLPIGKPK